MSLLVQHFTLGFLVTFLFCCLFPAVGFIATKKSLFRKMTGKNRFLSGQNGPGLFRSAVKNKATETRYAFCGCSRKSSAWNSPRKWLDGWESVWCGPESRRVELSVNEWSIDWLWRSDHEGREATRNERERDRERGRGLAGIVKADRQSRQCAHASVWEIERNGQKVLKHAIFSAPSWVAMLFRSCSSFFRSVWFARCYFLFSGRW